MDLRSWILTQDADQSMAGVITWQDERHFRFKIIEGSPGDLGLSLAKSY